MDKLWIKFFKVLKINLSTYNIVDNYMWITPFGLLAEGGYLIKVTAPEQLVRTPFIIYCLSTRFPYTADTALLYFCIFSHDLKYTEPSKSLRRRSCSRDSFAGISISTVT